jgi:hypothetical protein
VLGFVVFLEISLSSESPIAGFASILPHGRLVGVVRFFFVIIVMHCIFVLILSLLAAEYLVIAITFPRYCMSVIV